MAGVVEQSETVDRIDSLPPAHVRPASPSQFPDNFTQPPTSVLPEAHPLGGDDVAANSSMAGSRRSELHDRASRHKPLLPRYLPEHCRKAIDEKWAAKKARNDARYHKRCDKLNRKYGSTGVEHNKRQQKVDDKHTEKKKSLELHHSITISMAEWRARKKAEKQQKRDKRKERTPNALNILPAQAAAGTDGAGEPSSKRRKRASKSSSRRRTTVRSSSDAIFSFNGTG